MPSASLQTPPRVQLMQLVISSCSIAAVMSSHSVPVVSSHSDSAQIVITVVVVDQFYIAIFSALQQAHCAVVTCDSK